MNIAAYCRVSTDREEQLSSLRHQKEFFTAYAQKNGHVLVRLYADEGISGTSLKKRQQFKELMHDAAAGKFQMVVVKDVSRFARNTVDALQSIRTLKAMGIATLFLTANMDSMGDSEFILTLFSAMAQEESNNLSKRVKWGKRINAQKGRVPQCIFGYDRLDNFTLEPNPQEAQTVRMIFRLYTQEGMGCRTVSTQLNSLGFKTKQGGSWDAKGVRRVLGNPIYCGRLVNHKYEVEDFLTGHQVRLPEQEHWSHERPQWAIVEPEVYEKAQQMLCTRRAQYASIEPFRQGRYSGKHLFSTLIKCACCGRSFTRKSYTYTATRVYWCCVTNDQYTAQRCPNRVRIEEPELRRAIGQHLAACVGRDFQQRLLEELQQARPQAAVPDDGKRLQRLLLKKERYRELYANGMLTMAELQARLEPLERALQEPEPAAPKAPGEEELAAGVQRFLSLESMTNNDLRRLVEHICVHEDGRAEILIKDLAK